MAPIPFDQFRAEYLHVLSGPRYSRATMKKMVQVLRQVAELGVESTAQLTTQLATDYVIRRAARVCANTVRGELTYFRAACNYAIEEDYLARGPRWRRVWPRASPRQRKTLHAISDIGRLLDYLQTGSDTWQGHRLYALTALVAYTGVRRGEAQWAQWNDFDLADRIFYVVERQRLKTEQSANPVPIAEELVPIIRAWRWRARSDWFAPHSARNGPWTSGGPGRKPTEQLAAAGAAIGLIGMTFQSLRHTFATWGRRKWGIDALHMRDILRHTSIGTHERHYLHGADDLGELVQAVRNVSYR